MRTLQIVSHCWQYSRVLQYQLSSLVLYPPANIAVQMTVFAALDDDRTTAVLNAFAARLPALNIQIQPPEELLKRGIGRNIAAIGSTADVLWFADCDYFFGPGCLDSLADLPLDGQPLFFPEETLYNATRASGDEYARRAQDPAAVVDIDPADFVPHRTRKAIGGMQIVPGAVARKRGYCPDSRRHQKPATGTAWAHNTSEDRLFRAILGTEGWSWPIPACYRIRQSVPGEVD
ncbi:MAG: glycosyltransferase family 2 protein [Planctomycetaceae bacterium]